MARIKIFKILRKQNIRMILEIFYIISIINIYNKPNIRTPKKLAIGLNAFDVSGEKVFSFRLALAYPALADLARIREPRLG
jgi:hypothetical protein